jgi:hypothetical protein
MNGPFGNISSVDFCAALISEMAFWPHLRRCTRTRFLAGAWRGPARECLEYGRCPRGGALTPAAGRTRCSGTAFWRRRGVGGAETGPEAWEAPPGEEGEVAMAETGPEAWEAPPGEEGAVGGASPASLSSNMGPNAPLPSLWSAAAAAAAAPPAHTNAPWKIEPLPPPTIVRLRAVGEFVYVRATRPLAPPPHLVRPIVAAHHVHVHACAPVPVARARAPCVRNRRIVCGSKFNRVRACACGGRVR